MNPWTQESLERAIAAAPHDKAKNGRYLYGVDGHGLEVTLWHEAFNMTIAVKRKGVIHSFKPDMAVAYLNAFGFTVKEAAPC